MSFSPLTEQLIQALRTLPGVGPKSAQRMALHLLERDREGAQRLADNLHKAVAGVGHCQQCRLLSEDDLCHICSNPDRNPSLLCVVENPSDVTAIESAGGYDGLYFVLMGHLSPIDGIGPEDIGAHLLMQRLAENQIQELILATNTTVEGEATAHYLSTQAREQSPDLTISRIAHGIPVGSELEQVDGTTLHHALSGRQRLDTGA